jgi:hypothetical protein
MVAGSALPFAWRCCAPELTYWRDVLGAAFHMLLDRRLALPLLSQALSCRHRCPLVQRLLDGESQRDHITGFGEKVADRSIIDRLHSDLWGGFPR